MEAIPLFGYLWNGFYKREIALENGIFMNEKLKVNEEELKILQQKYNALKK